MSLLDMTYESYAKARRITRLEGHPKGDPHHYVKLPSGRWCRTCGAPSQRDCLPGRRLVQRSATTWEIV
ncbi:MAG TPA: hypothetical protein VIY27_05065 [Myxococcota bacterium]